MWFGGKAEEHEARVQKDWVKQDRRPTSFLSASGDQKVSEALHPSLEVPLHPRSSCIPKPKALCSGRMGIGPVYQSMSWLLSLSTGLALFLSHHSPRQGKWPPWEDLKFLCVTKATGIGPSSVGLKLRQSLSFVLLTRESQYTLNCMWPHRKGRLQESHLNIKRKKVEKSKLTCLDKIRLTSRFLELPVILFSIKF